MAGKKQSSGVRKGHRQKSTKVRTAKGRKSSSTRWLQRQLNDPYVALAEKEGYRSRAAYKLIELDDKFRFLKPGGVVVDLGAAPGSWTQVALERLRKRGQVIGIDLLEIEPLEGAALLQGNFLDEALYEELKKLVPEQGVDVVLSDMAANATGHKQTDHLRTMALCEAALDFAIETLAPGGVFVCKVLRGGTEHTLLKTAKQYFGNVKHVKPKASRQGSTEMYLVATEFSRR